ncbi:peptidyl-tRNA hydrolase-like [Lissotriton helveticus]
MELFLTPASVKSAPSRLQKKYRPPDSDPAFLRSDPVPDSVIVTAAKKQHATAPSSTVPPDKESRQMDSAGLKVCAERFGLGPEDVYLLHDELDKPLGKVSLKLGGSARGHNGVRSCIESLHSDVMVRLRVGIGRPQGRTSVERHVLEVFSSSEREVLPRALEQGVELLLQHIRRRDPSALCEGPTRADTQRPRTPSS